MAEIDVWRHGHGRNADHVSTDILIGEQWFKYDGCSIVVRYILWYISRCQRLPGSNLLHPQFVPGYEGSCKDRSRHEKNE